MILTRASKGVSAVHDSEASSRAVNCQVHSIMDTHLFTTFDLKRNIEN